MLRYLRKAAFVVAICLTCTISTFGQSKSPSLKLSWKYKELDHQVDLSFLIKDYPRYQMPSKRQPYQNFVAEIPGHPYHLKLASILDSIAKRAGCVTNLDYADFLRTFVQQSIRYQSDRTVSTENYPKYAIETLVEGWGDCEDSAILTATLFDLFGFNAVLLKYPSHVAVGVQCLDCSNFIRVGKQQFAYVETTAKGWHIGKVPERYYAKIPVVIQLKTGVVYNRNSGLYANIP
jgi:hypothetical protein